jgi:CHAT domain-containing protein
MAALHEESTSFRESLRIQSGSRRDRPFAHPCYWAGFVLIGDPK